MRCLNCDGKYSGKNGTLTFDDNLIGQFFVFGVEWKECSSCNKKRFPISTVEKIEEAMDRRREELLMGKPIKAFINSAQAILLLKCTRQAFNKNKRIKRGFIYHVNRDGVKDYLRESVEQYKKTGDGRIALIQHQLTDHEYVDKIFQDQSVGYIDFYRMMPTVEIGNSFGWHQLNQ